MAVLSDVSGLKEHSEHNEMSFAEAAYFTVLEGLKVLLPAILESSAFCSCKTKDKN
jgi:hypothetical protein